MQLVIPSATHLRELMGWFSDELSTSVWGGPSFRYPFTEETFKQYARWDELATYTLIEESGAMIAFGQIYIRAGRAHLARLAVAPSRRGQGIGERLITALIAKGARLFPACSENSLYVMRANERAVRCYKKMGFIEAPPPAEDTLPADQLFMKRRI